MALITRLDGDEIGMGNEYYDNPRELCNLKDGHDT